MTLKEVIKKAENTEGLFEELENITYGNDFVCEKITDLKNNFMNILPDIEKANLLQEEVIEALIDQIITAYKCVHYKWICDKCLVSDICKTYPKIKLIESIKNKSWEEIINEK